MDVSLISIRKDFLLFIPVTDNSGKGLTKVSIDSLTYLRVNLEYVRGQGYDGASAISGKFIGVKSNIRNVYPLAVHVPCCSYSLRASCTNADQITGLLTSE
jgi:hypothetical protein